MLQARYSTDDVLLEAGLDEAGRGSLWGPLFAAAVIWPGEEGWTEEVRTLSTRIRDSKLLSAKRRAVLEEEIKGVAVAYGIGRVEAEEIDRLGMTATNRLAFERALGGLGEKPGRIIVDGILGLAPRALEGIIQIVEPKADQRYLCVAAASILAKEAHDRVIAEACTADPTLEEKYSILRSKGYGTAKHRAGVQEHGMHSGHRRLFLRKLLGIDHVVASAAAQQQRITFLDD